LEIQFQKSRVETRRHQRHWIQTWSQLFDNWLLNSGKIDVLQFALNSSCSTTFLTEWLYINPIATRSAHTMIVSAHCKFPMPVDLDPELSLTFGTYPSTVPLSHSARARQTPQHTTIDGPVFYTDYWTAECTPNSCLQFGFINPAVGSTLNVRPALRRWPFSDILKGTLSIYPDSQLIRPPEVRKIP